jgi:hypothetical protein
MAENLNIPDELKGTFKRLMYRVPEKLRSQSYSKNHSIIFKIRG